MINVTLFSKEMKNYPIFFPLHLIGLIVNDSSMHYMVCCVADVQEDFAPPVADMPGQFPVYLRLPYRRDSYFCFRDENSQVEFISILSDCVRHQNKGITFTLMKTQ